MASFPKPYYRWRPHPWHGLSPGKQTGYLMVDRPQRGSSSPPTLYGLIPQTYCGERVASLSPEVDLADGDPLDICVISERPIDRSEVLLATKVVGGLRMIDHGEADDKIVAVLASDAFWADVEELDELPRAMVDRLAHYFLSYKAVPGTENTVSIPEIYGRDHAFAVVEASIADYQDAFGQ